MDHTAEVRALAVLDAAKRNSKALNYGGPGHSNAIAVSGRLAASGQPLLLGGPQLGYTVPQAFMELGLHGAGIDLTGVTLPGVIGVLSGAGHNHAWTVTSGGDDNQDLYVETLDPVNHPGRPGEGSGGLYNNMKNPSGPSKLADNPVGEWNRFRILMVGDQVTVYLNNELVVHNVTMENYWERDKPIYPTGQVELQHHGSILRFKNIYIREIPRR